MEERRRSKRVPVHMELCICDLFKQDTTGIHDLDSPIQVIEISRHGIGFISECVLPVGYYFNAKVDLYDEHTPSAFTFVKIIHCEAVGNHRYHYGCEFSQPAEDVYTILDACSGSFQQLSSACI